MLNKNDEKTTVSIDAQYNDTMQEKDINNLVDCGRPKPKFLSRSKEV